MASHPRGAELDRQFSEFVAARSSQLYRSACLLTTSPHAAEDLVQTVLAKAYASWSRVSGADDPVAYVHGMLINSFLSSRRRRSSGEVPVADTPDRVATDTDPSDRLALMAALRDLAPLDRAVVVLRFWEDHSVTRTAQQLNLSEAAVKNRSLRALRTLRGLLTDTSTPGSTR